MTKNPQVTLTHGLVDLHEQTDHELRYLVRASLVELRALMVSDALSAITPRREREQPERHIFRAKIYWATKGRELDRDAYCEATTKDRRRCALRPMLGSTRCHVHSSAEGKVKSKALVRLWEETVGYAMTAHGVYDAVKLIRDALANEEQV